MPVCPSCKAEGWKAGSPCRACGRVSRPPAAPELELALPAKQAPKPKPAATSVDDYDAPIELAVDLTYQHPPPVPMPPLSGGHATSGVVPRAPLSGAGPMSLRGALPGETLMHSQAAPEPVETEEHVQARMLADYGPAPAGWWKTPFYAYHVLKRQKELRRLLDGRREESATADGEAEDALVAFAERARASASKDPKYQRLLVELKAAEDLVRSRDQALAREQDAHADRLRAIDERISKLETELGTAQAQARTTGSRLADAQATLERVEAKVKRADIELRNATSARDPRRGA